jgi:DNA-binding HxlR family transcriptional regulator
MTDAGADLQQRHGDADANKSELGSLCPSFHQTVEFIGRRWMGAIVLTLMQGPRRFNELLAEVPGLSDRLLTERLRDLEEKGLVERRVLATSPVRVEYELTAAGQDLRAMFCAIQRWGHKWFEPATGE